MSSLNPRVSYFYDPEIGNFYYGLGHPMRPHRIRMAHNLVLNYGLYEKMEIFRPKLLSEEEMTHFHTDDYVHFLKSSSVDKDNWVYKSYTDPDSSDITDNPFNAGTDDCPVFPGLFKYCQLSSGGSVQGAQRLNRGLSDIAINWAGGLHHAKKHGASGFCFINDIVLAILELLKHHHRVLYIDIDIHHGDGVEEAFYSTDRVMTVSFHKFGDNFFPMTGDITDVGIGEGKNYSINFPLQSGVDDQSFMTIFDALMTQVMERFQPGAVVLQCGADSLAGDKLGSFNLSEKGHGHCVSFMKKFNKPLLVLGGGGYTIANVSRCWAYETGLCLGEVLNDKIPLDTEYYDYYGPDYTLNVHTSNMENLNTAKYMQETMVNLFQIMKDIPACPSVQFSERARDVEMEIDEDLADPDVRITQADKDNYVHRNNEHFASEADQDSTHHSTKNGRNQL